MDYYDNRAVRLHRVCPVVDAHLDLVTTVYRRCQAGESGCLKKYYLEKLREGGVNLVFASLFLGESEWKTCQKNGIFKEGAILKKSMEMLACFLEEINMAGSEAVLVTNRVSLSGVIKAKRRQRKWPVGIVLYLEGLDMLEGNPELLRCFYVMGVRGAALTWNKRPEFSNSFAEGCSPGYKPKSKRTGDIERVTDNRRSADDRRTDDMNRMADMRRANGIKRIQGTDADMGEMPDEMLDGKDKQKIITDSGVRVIALMEELGMFVDCSHLSDMATEILPFLTKKPYAATHSNARTLADHPRNLTDSQIIRLAERGGVIGINTYGEFVSDKKTLVFPVERLCRQITYLIKKAGVNHVGFGLDFGEGSCLTGYGQLLQITSNLLRQGYSEGTVRKILGENWVRFLWNALFC